MHASMSIIVPSTGATLDVWLIEIDGFDNLIGAGAGVATPPGWPESVQGDLARAGLRWAIIPDGGREHMRWKGIYGGGDFRWGSRDWSQFRV